MFHSEEEALGSQKITLFLMTKKGFSVLSNLIEKGMAQVIYSVVSARDKSIEEDYYADIKALWLENKINFYNKNDDYEIVTKYAFAVSWRWLLHYEKIKLIVFHDSILPKYRGFNPLVSYLLNKEREIGVTALFASEEFDAGPIIAQGSAEISYPIKLAEAIDVLCEIYETLSYEIATKIIEDKVIDSHEQDREKVSYSIWRDEQDYKIDWNKSSQEISLSIDSLGPPYLGASCIANGRKIRIYDAVPHKDLKIENRTPGKLLFKDGIHPVIICGTGLLKITDAVCDEAKQSILPLNKLKIRFE